MTNAEYQNGKSPSENVRLNDNLGLDNVLAIYEESNTIYLAAIAKGFTNKVNAEIGIQINVSTYATLVRGIIKKLPTIAIGENEEKKYAPIGISDIVIDKLSISASPVFLNLPSDSSGLFIIGYIKYAPSTAP